jgi:hypothetical protein
MPSPAEIVRAKIVKDGLAVYPGVTQQPDFGPLQCFVGELEDAIDRAMTVIDAGGNLQGRSQRTGQSLVHPGFKILLRSPSQEDSDYIYDLWRQYSVVVKDPFSVLLRNNWQYNVQSVFWTSDVIFLGEDKGTRRRMWTLNGRVVYQEPARTKLED